MGSLLLQGAHAVSRMAGSSRVWPAGCAQACKQGQQPCNVPAQHAWDLPGSVQKWQVLSLQPAQVVPGFANQGWAVQLIHHYLQAALMRSAHSKALQGSKIILLLIPAQVLEVTEQLLRQSDLLSDFSHQQMPADSLAGMFLSNLGGVLVQQPELGSVIR